jgi:predicted secreted protein
MAKRTGKDLNFLLGGTAIAVARGWTYEENDVDVDTTAAGDAWMDRESLRGDFTVDWNALLEVASPYVLPTTVRGTKTTFSCELIGADVNGIVAGTAKVNRFRIEAAYDGAVQTSGTLNCAGTAPTFDLSPAT